VKDVCTFWPTPPGLSFGASGRAEAFAGQELQFRRCEIYLSSDPSRGWFSQLFLAGMSEALYDARGRTGGFSLPDSRV